MADNDKGPPGGRNTPSPTPARRARAPTITIDTSAVNQQPEGNMDGPPSVPRIDTSVADRDEKQPFSQSVDQSPVELRNAHSFDSNRPTSPHNVSSPTSKGAPHSFLAVPGSRPRNNSFDTEAGASSVSGASSFDDASTLGPTPSAPDYDKSKAAVRAHELIGDEEALTPDPGTEADFERENNKFAFTPGQLGKMFNPKSLGAFHALGGLRGLEKGLRTDRQSGLSVDEEDLNGTVTFEDALAAAADDPGKSQLKRSDTTGSMKAPRDAAYADRKRIFSDNRLPARKAKSLLQLAWMAYNDKVLILLTIAAVISLALGLYETFGQSHEDGEAPVEWVEGVAIMVAIVIVVVVGALNDWQKERQFVKLNTKKDDRLIKVIRSGKTREISVHDVLVGDVVQLEPGDMVPVDGILIEGFNVKCDESSATGESDLLRKTGGDDVWRAIEEHKELKKMDPFILSGAKVSEGVGKFIVTGTGIHSSFGKTMMSLREESEVTPLQSKLNTLAEYIAKLGGAAGLLLFVVLLIEFLVDLKGSTDNAAQKGQHFLNILIVAITIIVVAVPEGLPLAVTLALAFATTRMLKDNNLVRLLRSCETMGNATTVCSDKTGTLTQNKMTVVAGILGTNSKFGKRQKTSENEAESPDTDYTMVEDDTVESPSSFVQTLSGDAKQLLDQSIVINSTAFEGEEDGKPAFIGSKTETALLSFARDYLGMGPISTERCNAKVVQFIPFDSGRKCMAAVVKLDNGVHRMYVKGASEILLEQATTIIEDPTRELNPIEMSKEQREFLNSTISSYASRSLRTIGFLYRDFGTEWPPKGVATEPEDPKQADFESLFQNMTFMGVVGIQDPLREGVREAVLDCQHAGVFVRMVTGDNVETARAIATDCGILVPGGLVLEGPNFRKMGRREMAQAIPKLCVLARSSPEDKRILVKRLKELGETVAVTGDGTNDAPALKTADVGFSMGIAGTEVAKEASAIILMDDNFSSIVKALLWGRAVNDAVRKFLQFQITVNITAVLLTFISAVASSDQSSVLTAVQLLWVNLIMDTFAALALATDPPTRNMLNRKPDPKHAPLITLNMWKMIIGQAIYQLVVTLVLHFAGNSILGYDVPPEYIDGVRITKTVVRHDPRFAQFKDWMRLDTLVFNTFVWMQIFNEFNNRRLDNKFNIFEGLQRNYFFIAINMIMVGGQVMIIFIGGAALTVDRLNGSQWGISIVLGAISLPVAVIIRLIPDDLIRKLIPNYFKRKAQKPTFTLEDENNFQWNAGLMDIREELTFLRKMRGGRVNQFKWKLQHPRELLRSRSGSRLSSKNNLPQTPPEEPTEDGGATPAPPTPDSRSRRSGRSRSNSAFGAATAMAGIVAGSIAGWSPTERHSQDSMTFNDVLSAPEPKAARGPDAV